MARPNPTTFEKDSPMSPQSAGSNISYQTNVNRQKTKKWAEAKPANYGGDDWGDEYDYDPPPPPIAKPTGLRQQGQALQSPVKADSPVVDNSRKYGDLPPLPGASNPRERANSFDEDDEKRNFSNNAVRQPSPPTAGSSSANAPATRFSQITGVPTVRNTSGPPLQISTQSATQPPTGLRKASQVVSPISGSPHPDILQPGRVNSRDGSPAGTSSIVSPASDTRTPSSDYQARRDFSPSAVPPPLATRASPAPQHATDSPTTKFPPRKSSMSQSVGPELSDITGPPQAQPAPKPWTAPRSASPGAAGQSPATPTGKALPFIRPADIYRRMEEERERERQSMDSGRPSMDSIVGAKSSERSDSPAKSHLREKTSSDSLGGRRSRTSLEADDASESSRPRPVLEPVKERKSEYGFEGFNVNDQAAQQDSESMEPVHDPTVSQHDQLDIEEARRFSTSPKLPDLNRISGFGIDMFSQSKPEDTPLSATRDTRTTPTAPTTTHLSSPNTDPSLRNQPSFGFRSVVNQAFDRTDDSSTPTTPASHAVGGVSRTASESTGTDGISPIMSRVPSEAVRDRNRDPSNPTILEVVNEPVSPVQLSQESETGIQSGSVQVGPPSDFRPGYRRDISTPSRENSPARHADLAKTKTIPSGQHAVVSETSPDIGDEPLQPPRPIANREQSFRPALPGGWTSYATSADSEAPTQHSVERTQTPVPDVSPVQESQEEHDYDITPTTTRHGLPQSTLGTAAAGAAVGGLARAALGRHDKPSPSGTPVPESPRVLASNSALPTSDPVMAPSDNLYSTSNLDPRLLPKLAEAPPETQLRPDVVNRTVSAESSVVPTSPPKDYPVVETTHNDSEDSLKPTVPLKQRTLNEVEAESLESPRRPEILPSLSTDTRSYDEENDKLRKEIVKSLSPRPSDGGQHRESMFANDVDDGPSGNQGHESTYLPDYYWTSNAEDEEPLPATAGAETKPKDLHLQSETVSPVTAEPPIEPEVDSPVIQPLSPHRPETGSQIPQRPSLPNRFSWEEGSENVIVGPQEEPAITAENIDHEARNAVHEPTSATIEAKNMSEPLSSTRENAPAPSPSGRSREGSEERNTSPGHHTGRDAALLAGGAAVAGAAVAAHGPQSPEHGERRLSLAEEKDPRVSSYPVSPTPPENEHPANSPTAYFSPSGTQLSHVPTNTLSPVGSLVKSQLSPTSGKLLGFREIVAIQSTEQRIQTFDETRHRWAKMDSGLTDWMARLQAQYPEHTAASSGWGGSRLSAPAGSSRSKFGKASGGNAPPLQEPYYRQYLNASPTTPSTPTKPGPGPGPNLQSGSHQGFSPAGNKLTSHQVQAKGKELLHSAGIFGGKAGKAGKGLLAKGKNKLRGAGGGDKTSPPPKPKTERRTSWGLPLNLSRSSGQPDSSTRLSKENAPVPTPERSRGRSESTSSPVPQLPPLASDHSLGTMSGALHVTNLAQGDESAYSQQAESNIAADESRDTLGVPAPIGKFQPSWDPFNATPIVEEDGFQYEEHSKLPPQFSSESGRKQGSLIVPVDTVSKSDRSNSSDAHFYDSRGNQADIPDDWVVVSPDPEYKDAPVEEGTEVAPELKPEAEQEPKKSIDVPTTSILNRPRGSSYVIPSPPPSARAATFSTSPPRNTVPTSTATAVQSTPPVQFQSRPSTSSPPTVTSDPVTAPVQSPTQNAPQAQPEEQAGGSFLPPIRRTSTFGFGFGPRQAKPRFSIEDEDDDAHKSTAQQKAPEHREAEISAATGAAAGIAAIAHHEQKKDAETSAPQPPVVENVSSQPAASVMNQSVENEGQANQPQQATVTESSRQVPPIQTSFRQEPLASHPTSARPPIEQAGSSEYSLQPGSVRPPLNQASSSDDSQRAVMSDPKAQQPSRFIPPRATDVAFRPQNFTESHVEWRPNRPKVAPAPTPTSPSYWKEQDIPPPRSSLDQPSLQSRTSWEQRGRGYSGSSQSYTQRADGYSEKGPWPGSPQQQKPFEQPPSAAQRYPELFRSENQVPEPPRDSQDLPAHYYQEPIPRAAAFLPRQQTNEYQLPGVGPPGEEPPRSARRNSGFFRDIGGKLSRTSSRERVNSISQDGAMPSPTRPFEPRGEYAESEAPSEGALEQKKRRSGFFGGLKRGSTSGLGPPVSQESVIAHLGSRTDLLAPQPSPPAQHERKRSIFGSHSSEAKEKPNKLTRTSTGTLDESGKKKRFSGFTGLFGKSGSLPVKEPAQERPQPTRELSYAERQPLESPGLPPNTNLRPPVQQPQTPSQNAGQPSQQRRILSRLTSSTSQTPSQSPRQESKTRKASTSGILGGLMGRRSQQLERGGSDDSRSQSSQPTITPQPLPPAQTYTDLQNQQATPPPQMGRPQQPRGVSLQDQSTPPPDRGRQESREPQYDSVPIPGGYSLVRGQGAVPVPTEYDPRGYNWQQVDPRYAQPRAQGFYQPNPTQGYQQPNGQQYQGDQQPSQPQNGRPKPNLGAAETYNSYTTPRRLSREDLLARSPPKSPEGQQRPYQLSLPDEDTENDRPAPLDKDVFPSPPSVHSQPLKHDAIQRLQQPTLRHPESPAGYPLPDDTVFSPINPAAQGIPAPPAPRWPGPQPQNQNQHANQENQQRQHSNSLTQSLSTMDIDLDRSNTRRTAVSAVSGISDPHNPVQSVRGSLNVPGKNGVSPQFHDEGEGRGNVSVLRSSPTPPSPMGGNTPEREVSPERGGGQIKTTELRIRPQSALSSGEDLYNASPRVPKNMQFPTTSHSNLGPGGNGNVRRGESNGGGKENVVGRGSEGGSGRERLRRAQEEKILIGENGEEIEVEIDENEPPSMSATSYPGQEWNPYAAGGWDDGYD